MAPHSLIKKKWVHRAVAELGHFPSYSFCCSENKEVKKKEDPSWGGSKGGEGVYIAAGVQTFKKPYKMEISSHVETEYFNSLNIFRISVSSLLSKRKYIY